MRFAKNFKPRVWIKIQAVEIKIQAIGIKTQAIGIKIHHCFAKTSRGSEKRRGIESQREPRCVARLDVALQIFKLQ